MRLNHFSRATTPLTRRTFILRPKLSKIRKCSRMTGGATIRSNLVGWTKQVAESRLVYLQGGDDPVAYASPEYQRLIQNAVYWVAGQ